MMRKLRASAFSVTTSRRNCPITRVASPIDAARLRHLDGIVAKIRQFEFALQQSAIGMRIGAHAPLARRRERLQIPAAAGRSSSNSFSGSIAAHPLLEQSQMLGVAARVGDRHLVRAPEPLDLQAIDFFRAGPALGTAQHDHRPVRARSLSRVRRAPPAGSPRIRSNAVSSVAAISDASRRGSSPSTNSGS